MEGLTSLADLQSSGGYGSVIVRVDRDHRLTIVSGFLASRATTYNSAETDGVRHRQHSIFFYQLRREQIPDFHMLCRVVVSRIFDSANRRCTVAPHRDPIFWREPHLRQ